MNPPPHPTLIKEASLSVLDEADESSDEFTSSQPVQLAPPVHHSEDEVDNGAESHDDTQKKNPAPGKLPSIWTEQLTSTPGSTQGA